MRSTGQSTNVLAKKDEWYIRIHDSRISIHTYIYNWTLQAFSQDYSLASHATHVGCVNFIRECILNCSSIYSVPQFSGGHFFHNKSKNVGDKCKVTVQTPGQTSGTI